MVRCGQQVLGCLPPTLQEVRREGLGRRKDWRALEGEGLGEGKERLEGIRRGEAGRRKDWRAY